MNIYTTPTHDEFFKYAQQHGWADWAEELWEEMNRTNWLKNKGKKNLRNRQIFVTFFRYVSYLFPKTFGNWQISEYLCTRN